MRLIIFAFDHNRKANGFHCRGNFCRRVDDSGFWEAQSNGFSDIGQLILGPYPKLLHVRQKGTYAFLGQAVAMLDIKR